MRARVKAAVQLGRGAAADEALEALFGYFDLPVQGLWHDTWETDGKFPDSTGEGRAPCTQHHRALGIHPAPLGAGAS